MIFNNADSKTEQVITVDELFVLILKAFTLRKIII